MLLLRDMMLLMNAPYQNTPENKENSHYLHFVFFSSKISMQSFETEQIS